MCAKNLRDVYETWYEHMVSCTDYILSLLQNANTNRNLRNGEQVLDAEEFVTFYMNLMSRSEVKELFTRYTELDSDWVLITG
jgi:hypothetical protein